MTLQNLDPEIAAAVRAIPIGALNREVLPLYRTELPPPPLSDKVSRTDHAVPGDPEVPVRLHRALARVRQRRALVMLRFLREFWASRHHGVAACGDGARTPCDGRCVYRPPPYRRPAVVRGPDHEDGPGPWQLVVLQAGPFGLDRSLCSLHLIV